MKVIVFSLFSEIWEHSVPESLLANHLKVSGEDVEYLFCGGILKNLCTSMEARLLDIQSDNADKRKICKNCQFSAGCFEKKIGGKHHYLKEYLSEEINNIAIKHFESFHLSKPLECKVGEIEVGKYALYETVLKFKKANLLLEDKSEIEYFKTKLFNVTLVSVVLESFLKQNKDYQKAMIYSPQYAINHAASTIFENNRIDVTFMEAGVNVSNRLDTLRAWSWNEFKLVNPLLSHWEKVSGFEISKSEVKTLVKHFHSLLEANSHMVYSSKFQNHRDVRKLFNIKADKKIMLATLSSYDEAYSAYVAGLFPKEKACSDVFIDQVEWIKFLINFVKTRDDVFLIIRVHPRDFPNKRDRVQSYQAKELLKVFNGNELENIKVNWPEENISLYELFDEIDVLLTGWSVTAVEAASLGIPVVTYDANMPSYPKSIMLTGRSKEDYTNNLNTALDKGWSFDQVVNSYHWLAGNHIFLSLPVTKNFTKVFNLLSKRPTKAVFKILKMFNVNLNLKLILHLTKPDKEGLDSIRKVVIGQHNSNDISDYVLNREKLSQEKFRKIVKDEFLDLMKIYYKRYDKLANPNTLHKKILELNCE